MLECREGTTLTYVSWTPQDDSPKGPPGERWGYLHTNMLTCPLKGNYGLGIHHSQLKNLMGSDHWAQEEGI